MKTQFLALFLFVNFLGFGQVKNYIAVTGTASKEVKADQLVLTVGVAIKGTDSKDVFNQASEIYTKGIDGLKKFKKNCKYSTDIIRLTTVYNNTQGVKQQYESRQSLTVVITDFSAYSEILSSLMDAGFNSIINTEFKYSKTEALKKEALDMAITAAKEKAKSVAAQLNCTLMGIQSFEEQSAGRVMYANKMDSYSGGSSPTHSLEPGNLTVSISVNVKYSIQHLP